MARWDLVYGGSVLIQGLNDRARRALQTEINVVLSAGRTGWFELVKPGDAGAVVIHLSAGVPIAFVSEDATADVFEDDSPGVLYGGVND